MARERLIAGNVQALENTSNTWSVPVPHVKVRKYLHLCGEVLEGSECHSDNNVPWLAPSEISQKKGEWLEEWGNLQKDLY